ncbi:MAG: GTPase domain-containing protein [Labilithrix sp.]|nr:GTPase domain-containing protein [Labilithrix sp.]
MQLNFAAREVAIKLVYYGPALSGKTTNLKALHELTRADSRGRLMTLETKDDRTLFFDMLPLVFKAETEGGAMNLRVKVFTVPGQVVHASTRRLVLQGADAVAFIADSQVAETENNAASFLDLRTNLKELGRSMRDVPLVIQFNKRDLPNVRSDAEIDDLARRGKEPVFKASAVHGQGVMESFFGLLERAWRKLDGEHDLTRKLGIQPDEFLAKAAASLGYEGKARMLCDAHVGGVRAGKGGA